MAWTTDQIIGRILPKAAVPEVTLGAGGCAVESITVPAHLVDAPLKTIQEPGKWSVFAISRAGRTIFPDEKTVMQENDVLHVCVVRDHAQELAEALEPPREAV